MKNCRFLILVAFALTGWQPLQSQNLFVEDFETPPVTSLLNDIGGETQLPDGPSACGFAARGNAATFNSASVDFQGSQNTGYFLAVNPQSPCGGFYTANLHSQPLNFSAADSLVFSCRYYKTNTLLWGPATLEVNIKNGTSDYILSGSFTSVGTWTNFTIGIPSTQIGSADSILITLGGGEGVAIDDITITNIPATSMKEKKENHPILLGPNPVLDYLKIDPGTVALSRIVLRDGSGRELLILDGMMEAIQVIDMKEVAAGVYFLTCTSLNGQTSTYKILK